MDIVAAKYDYPAPARLLSPQEAVTHVLDRVGVTFPWRDAVDQRLVAEVRSWGKSGQLVSDETASPMFGPGYVAAGTKPADADGDGIPDAWERANGLNPADASDAMKISASGYANIELYLNSLVPSSY
ncbi:putative pectate lyase C [Rosellinia necatrix]|uniref:Putative pectate lyase C n=1 Tax=Rosellinia necatrix TaxID=77044 RepID=A0A1S8A4W5_ROSNE|nr:putative pectate lyase C [Rosellinia necatrix]